MATSPSDKLSRAIWEWTALMLKSRPPADRAWYLAQWDSGTAEINVHFRVRPVVGGAAGEACIEGSIDYDSAPARRLELGPHEAPMDPWWRRTLRSALRER